MFKHAFHAGPSVEVLSTQGKNPLEKFKQTGTIQKAFDSQMKGYIFTIDGQSKIQLPKDEKETLGLIQPFIVFQIFIPLGKNLHIEIGITDSTKTRRRLIFHSGAKEVVSNPLHARLPITSFRRNQWVNLSIDVATFTKHCFKSVQFRSIDYIEVTASCKLRRVFTMRNPLYDDQQEEEVELAQMVNQMMAEEMRENLPQEYIPSNLGFPQGFVHFNQLIFPHRLRMESSLASSQVLDENINQTNSNQSSQIGKQIGQRTQQLIGRGVAKQANENQSKEKKIGAVTSQKGVQQKQYSGTGMAQAVLSKKENGLSIGGKGIQRRDSNASSSNKMRATQEPNIKRGVNEDIQEEEEQKGQDDRNHYVQNEYVDRLGEDDEADEDKAATYNWRRADKSQPKSPMRRVAKEDLKEQEHYLYLQNQSDEEDQQAMKTLAGSKQTLGAKRNSNNNSSIKKNVSSNPWDVNGGRQAHDNKTAYNTLDQSQKQPPLAKGGIQQPRTQQQFNSKQQQQQRLKNNQIKEESSSKLRSDKSPAPYTKLERDKSSNRNVSFAENASGPTAITSVQDNVTKQTSSDFQSLKLQIQNNSAQKQGIEEFRRRMIMEKDEEDEQRLQANSKTKPSQQKQLSPYDAAEIRKLNPYDYTREIMKELNDQKNQEPKAAKTGQTANNFKPNIGKNSKQQNLSKKPQLKQSTQQSLEEDALFNHLAKGSKYNNFNLGSWGMNERDNFEFNQNRGAENRTEEDRDGIDENIEEAFEQNHDNFMNYFNDNKFTQQAHQRKSKEFRQNPIDFDLDKNPSEDEEDYGARTAHTNQLSDQVQQDYPDDTSSKYDIHHNTQDTTRMYQKLESSRKEERRPFSPPFRFAGATTSEADPIETYLESQQKQILELQKGPNAKLDLKLDVDEDNQVLTEHMAGNGQNERLQDQRDRNAYLKVQKTEILRDSLDNALPSGSESNRASQANLPDRATVQNENGDLLEVIYDPILQCFYDPKSNSYYELKYK